MTLILLFLVLLFTFTHSQIVKTTDSAKDSNSEEFLNLGNTTSNMILTIVIAILVFLILIVCIIWCIMAKTCNKNNNNNNGYVSDNSGKNRNIGREGQRVPDNNPNSEFIIAELDIHQKKYSDMNISEKLTLSDVFSEDNIDFMKQCDLTIAQMNHHIEQMDEIEKNNGVVDDGNEMEGVQQNRPQNNEINELIEGPGFNDNINYNNNNERLLDEEPRIIYENELEEIQQPQIEESEDVDDDLQFIDEEAVDEFEKNVVDIMVVPMNPMDDVEEWDNNQVIDWINKDSELIRFNYYFQVHNINGKKLFKLNDYQLREHIGIMNDFDRLLILNKIKELRDDYIKKKQEMMKLTPQQEILNNEQKMNIRSSYVINNNN